MKRYVLILSAFLLFSGCRSLGSWYGRTPSPVESFDFISGDSIGFKAERVAYKDSVYDLVAIDPQIIPLKTVLSDDAQGIRFSDIDRNDLIFAVNGGIFTEEMTPLGYYANEGIELYPLNRGEGYGNFYLKPNGLLYLSDSKPYMEETESFASHQTSGMTVPDLAIQSGPLLIHEGMINKAFTPGSQNKYVRTGVGISRDDKGREILIFAISNSAVNFYDFALFFRDIADCDNALYLDGHIAAMFVPELNREQTGRSYATLLYSVKQKGSDQ